MIPLLFITMFPLWCSAEEEARRVQQSGIPSTNDNTPPSYCGVYSLHRAARALGRDILFREWLKPKYISSREGSSLSDLIHAAADQGLYAAPMSRMTCAMLRHIRCPVILHVKNNLSFAKEYNHWVLFLGTENGKARICDGIRPLENVDFTDLAARWDGVGLLVDKAPISMSIVWLVAAAQLIFYGGACAAIIGLLLWLQHWWTSKPHWISLTCGWRASLHELAMLFLLALVLGASFRWVHPGRFLSSAPSVAAIQEMHLGKFLEAV